MLRISERTQAASINMATWFSLGQTTPFFHFVVCFTFFFFGGGMILSPYMSSHLGHSSE